MAGFSVGVFLLATAFAGGARAEIQGRFVGPVSLKIWKHWQASWNVENTTPAEGSLFELIRARDRSGNAYVTLNFRQRRRGDAPLRARLQCTAYVRNGDWSVEERTGRESFADGSPNGESMGFSFYGVDDCIDTSEERIVTRIRFEVLSGRRSVYAATLVPMYVRGKHNSYWKNPIDPYLVHGGEGSIQVAASMAGEMGWDLWDGILVKPSLGFVERSLLTAGSVLGLHRHERNQEVLSLESGSVELTLGMAARVGDSYRVQRKWDSTGKSMETEEFQAQGGWMETRTLHAGELGVIVPNPERQDMVYFHGLKVVENLVLWTMGSRN